MPLAYYDQLPPAPDGWAVPSCGYIWFGAPYDEGADRAAAYGWPTAHLPGGHLHMLIDPDAVAAAVLKMAGAWTDPRAPAEDDQGDRGEDDQYRGRSVETELVALDVLHHQARLVVVIGS